MLTKQEIWELVEQYVEDRDRYPTCDSCHAKIPYNFDDWAVAVSQDGTTTFLCPDCAEVEFNV